MVIEFGALTELAQAAVKLDFNRLMFRIFNEDHIQDIVIDLNTFDQLYNKGEDSKGEDLGKYAPSTIEYKIASGQRFDHITLNDTGDFYDSWTVTAKATYFEMDNDPIKGKIDLSEEYGEDILGLSDESLTTLSEDVQEELIDKITNELL